MDYKVLYRKYRPTNFDDVVGQENTITFLKESIINDKISHAYIFSGPRGTGKTSTAKIFAKTINCINPIDGKPCEKCDNCLNFKSSNDIYEIDAASNNGVDQIREIIDNIKLSPIHSKYKVYIIDEVHMLSTSAFNALLLTLEEPPSHAIFILATTNIENVPITVLSRCQRMDFKKISNEIIINRLRDISNIENIDITDEALKEIAIVSDGGLRDALSLLDQLSKHNGTITEELVQSSIGVISYNEIEKLVNSIENSNVDSIDEFILKVKENAIDYKTIIKKLIDVIKNRCINIQKVNIISNIGYSNYKKLCFELADTLYKANVNVDSYTLLELILLDYVNLNKEIPHKMGDSLNEESKPIDKKIEKPESKANSYNLVNIRINNCFVDANKEQLNNIKNSWPDILDSIDDKKIKGLLVDSDVVLASSRYIVLSTEFIESSDLINDNIQVIEDYLKKYLNQDILVISTDKINWSSKMAEFKKNYRNGIKYNFIEEPVVDNSTELVDIFSSSKIEIN